MYKTIENVSKFRKPKMNKQAIKELLNPAILRDILREMREAEECANEVIEMAVDNAFEAMKEKNGPKFSYGSTDIR